MRRWLVSCALLGIALACSRQRGGESALPKKDAIGFVDRVWTVTEAPGGPGDIYVFLSDGTFVRAAKEARPDVGKWSWDGKQLTLIWSQLPYTADIDSLTSSYFKLTFHFMERSFDVGLVPAAASMPDTTQPVEFDPTHALVIAQGDKPAWLFHVEGDRGTLRTAREGTVSYEGEWSPEEPRVWFFDGKRTAGQGSDRVTLTIREDVCEVPSGGESPFSAMLDHGQETWHGCAVAGDLPHSELSDSTK